MAVWEGNACSNTDGSAGGSGGFGVYIQANRIVAGTIEASGQAGGSGGSGGGGGGGSGFVLLAYGFVDFSVSSAVVAADRPGSGSYFCAGRGSIVHLHG